MVDINYNQDRAAHLSFTSCLFEETTTWTITSVKLHQHRVNSLVSRPSSPKTRCFRYFVARASIIWRQAKFLIYLMDFLSKSTMYGKRPHQCSNGGLSSLHDLTCCMSNLTTLSDLSCPIYITMTGGFHQYSRGDQRYLLYMIFIVSVYH